MLTDRHDAYFEDIGNAVVVHKQLHLGAVGGSEHGVDLVGSFDCDRRLHGECERRQCTCLRSSTEERITDRL